MIRPWKTAMFQEGDGEYETPEILLGLTKRQREWIKRAYSEANGGVVGCFFPTYTEKAGWSICGAGNVQCHHINPKGYSWRIDNEDPDNNPYNIITLCKMHHIGSRQYTGTLNWRKEVVPVVHPDIEWARRRYRGTAAPTSYDQVFEGREKQLNDGVTYWNTDWDVALREMACDVIGNYIINHPDDVYPVKKRRQR